MGLEFEDEEAPPPKKKVQYNQKQKRNLLVYDGQVGEIYKIWLLNLFLTIITLGAYTFWGRVRMRRYIVGSFSLKETRFEFSGRGIELLIGFIKSLPVLAVLVVCMFAPFYFFYDDRYYWNQQHIVFYLALIPAFFVLLFILNMAKYGSMRYRISRTSWKGVRGYMEGSGLTYGFLAVKRYIINVLTLTFLVPASDIAKHSYMANNVYLGDIHVVFNEKMANKGDLLRAHNKIYRVLYIGTAAYLLSWFAWYQGFPGFSYLLFIISSLFTSKIIMVARIWYATALVRTKLQGLSAGPFRFECEIDDKELAKLVFGNIMIFIFTLGLGYPLIQHRKMSFLADHVVIFGNLDAEDILQVFQTRSSTLGEGLDEILGDVDVGIFG